MRILNTDQHYGAAAILLHWFMAVLIASLIALGLYMVRLPDAGYNTTKVILILLHKEIGMLVLPLVAIRLAWRELNRLPRLAETLPEWQKVTAVFVHLCFYALMIALPLTGWLMSSSAAFPVSLLNLSVLPDFVPHDEVMFERLRQIHDGLAYAMTVLIGLHLSGALQHHFLLHDDTLRKMLPAM